MTRSRLVALLLACSLCCSCGISASDDPAAQFNRAVESAYDGDLVGFYRAAVPPSYDRDLNRILRQARTVVDERRFERLKGILKTFGADLSVQLKLLFEASAEGGRGPASSPMDSLQAVLSDLATQLGLDSYQDWESADVSYLLTKLQDSPAAQGLKTGRLPLAWSRQSFRTLSRDGGNALLEVQNRDSGAKKPLDVQLVDGVWVPTTLAHGWRERILPIQERLNQWQTAQEQDPTFVDGLLDRLEEQLDRWVVMAALLVRQVLDFSSSQDG